MDDLGAMLGQFLNSQEGQEQLRAVASALGNQGGGGAQAAPAGGSGGQIDIASLLAGLQGGAPAPQPVPQPQPAQAAQGGGLDLSQLGQMLSNLQAPASSPSSSTDGGSGLNLGSLASLLGNPNGGGGTGASAASNPLPGLDLGAIMSLQQAFASFSQTDRNVDVLLSIKPHLSPERAKKADDAIRILQLIKLLPLIKDTGLFGDMSWLGGGGAS